MHSEDIENEDVRSVYEPPSFEEAGSFRNSTGFVVLIAGDPNTPGWL